MSLVNFTSGSQETTNSQFSINSSLLCNLLRQLRVNKSIDLGVYRDRLVVVNVDTKSWTVIARCDVKVDSLSHQGDLYGCVDQSTLIKTLQRFEGQDVEFTTVSQQSYITVHRGGKKFKLPFSVNNHSRMMVTMTPCKNQQKDIEVQIPPTILRQICRDLQAVDVRARITFEKKKEGLELGVYSMSSQVKHLEDVRIIPWEVVGDQRYMREDYVSSLLVLSSEIGTLLKLLNSARISLLLYEQYLVIDCCQAGARLTIPRIIEEQS